MVLIWNPFKTLFGETYLPNCSRTICTYVVSTAKKTERSRPLLSNFKPRFSTIF